MSTISARISLTLAVQATTGGTFPSLQTYPASFERLLLPNDAAPPKVFAAEGVIPAGTGLDPGSVTLPVAGSLASVRYWYVENMADPDVSGTANVVVAGGPVSGTVARGQILLATNDRSGWPAASVTLSGTAGTPYKVIAIGV